MKISPVIQGLIDALCCLPGVGPRSAQRMVLHLLMRNREGGRHLAEALRQAITLVGNCESCRDLTELKLCPVCQDPRRDDHLLCIVETPADLFAIEQSGGFRGRYFVLLGRLSPIDGLGPEEIGMSQLEARLDERQVTELILATNPTVEGEATAHYVFNLAHSRGIRVTRLAQGVPLGGELEYLDGGTLTEALAGRRPVTG